MVEELVEFQVDRSSGFFTGSDLPSDLSVTNSGSLEVTYNYSTTAVPAPKTFSMSIL